MQIIPIAERIQYDLSVETRLRGSFEGACHIAFYTTSGILLKIFSSMDAQMLGLLRLGGFYGYVLLVVFLHAY